MFAWPQLELTDYERQFVRPYKTSKYPGVLRRTYERTISNDTQVPFREGLQPSEQIQISRRSRVFGITFSGGLSATRLQITNASGTLYNVADVRTGKFGYVSSLIGSSPYMEGSTLGRKPAPTSQGVNEGTLTQNNVYLSGEHGALIIDPNWVLTPNETLIFNGDWSDLDALDPVPTIILNIAIHVWEFPSMGNADKAVREVV